MRFCTALFAACAGLIVSIAGSLPASAATRHVVLLFGERVELPALSAMEAEITRTLRSNSAERTEIFSENMDLSRFGSPSYRAALRDFLHQKYSDKKIDVAVAVMAPALDFLLTSGDAIFPGASIAFSGLDRGELADRPLPRSVDGVFSKREFAPTLELALRLHPETRQIVVVSGTSDFEASLLADAKKEFTAFEKRVSFTYVSNVPLKELLAQLSQLPKQSIVLFISFFRDGAGESFVPQEVVERVSSASSVPVYGFTDQFLGRGIVGGSLYSFAALGTETAKLIARILTEPAHTQLLLDVPRRLMFDWRQMQRWGVSENRLPPGSEIQSREPPLWDRYRWQMALIVAVVLGQAVLIGVLMNERRRRRYAEIQVGRRTAELAHFNRYSMAGELTASIAHELNQPLGSILTNAETAELLLKSSAPDLAELREIVADIRHDDKRASEVLQRLRSMLKKAPSEISDLDLNEIAGESVQLLSPLSIAREINLSGIIAPLPLPIRGDPVQLQQVIVNLIVNAMDAVSKMPRAERRVTVSTARDDDFAEVSVTDTGSGIPTEKIKEVFEPFFTTKAQGMGLGLSIARTIVESHKGQLSAENRANGGATFRVKLPLAAAPQ